MYLEKLPKSFQLVENGENRKDISHWAYGPRSQAVVGLHPWIFEARSKFTATGNFSDSPLAIFLPDTTTPSDIAFQAQIPVAQELGANIVLLDYSPKRFSNQMLRAQLMDFITSYLVANKKVFLIGASFGAANILDLLVNDPEASARIEKAVMMGTVYSLQDIANFFKANALTFVNRLPNGSAHVLGPPVRRFWRIMDDPGFDDKARIEIQSHMSATHSLAILERLKSIIIRKSIEEVDAKIPTPVLFIKWERDEISEDRHFKLGSTFPNQTTVTIPGIHGHTVFSANEINKRLFKFLNES